MDNCKCKYCKTIIEWETTDKDKGNIYSCDCCNEFFCSDCFEKKTGMSIQAIMDAENVECPACIDYNSVEYKAILYK